MVAGRGRLDDGQRVVERASERQGLCSTTQNREGDNLGNYTGWTASLTHLHSDL